MKLACSYTWAYKVHARFTNHFLFKEFRYLYYKQKRFEKVDKKTKKERR